MSWPRPRGTATGAPVGGVRRRAGRAATIAPWPPPEPPPLPRILANTYVRDFGLRLLPGLYAMYNPMPYDAAREMEVELGIALREAGYGVWQA